MARSYAGEIAEAAGRVTGRPMRVEIASPIAKGEPEEEKSEASQTTEKDLSEGPESHPLVSETMEVFGASIKRVDPIRPETDETADGNGSA